MCLLLRGDFNDLWGLWYKRQLKNLPQVWTPASESRASGLTLCKDWPRLTHVREMLSDWKRSDPSGEFHGRNAHMPLLVKFCTEAPPQASQGSVQAGQDKVVRATQHSERGMAMRRLRNEKSSTWRATGSWPWWMEHPSEATSE